MNNENNLNQLPSLMTGNAKHKLLKIIKWFLIILILLPAGALSFLIFLAVMRGASFTLLLFDFLEIFLPYLLFLAFPFITYVSIGEALKIYTKQRRVFLLLIISPIISIIFSTIYFLITGSGGLMFGALPGIILYALIHLGLGLITSIIIYFKG